MDGILKVLKRGKMAAPHRDYHSNFRPGLKVSKPQSFQIWGIVVSSIGYYITIQAKDDN